MDKRKKKESPLLSLLLNIVIPSYILMKISTQLGNVNALLLALAFPIGYGVFDFIRSKELNIFSILGLTSVLLTGVIGLLELHPRWIAIKEAAIPLLIGIVVIATTGSKYAVVKKIIYNDQLLNMELINIKLEEYQSQAFLEKKLQIASYLVGGSFFFSAFLNYVLAKIILVSQPGTEAFNEELGKMTALSFPVIALPSTLILILVLWYLLKNIGVATQLNWREILKNNSNMNS